MFDITILGAYGSRSKKGGSSAFLLDSHTVIDAGNLLDPLQEKSSEIETIWLTHSHLDHIVDIAYILDNYFENQTKTLILRGLPETLKTLREHFFNHKIWPDFSTIPLHSGAMALGYEPLILHTSYLVDAKTSIKAFPTDHTVPSCGYVITKEQSSLLITADTYSLKSTIAMVERDSSIGTLVVECSFPSAMTALAKESRHLTPKLLFEKLKPLENRGLKLYINHLKPAFETVLHHEIVEMKGCWEPTILTDGESIIF